MAVAWYLPEAFSKRAREWRDLLLAGRIQLLVPPLHYLEFANVLRSYVRRSELGGGLAQEIYSLHLEAPLETAEAPREAILATALEYGATAHDAVYIHLAVEHGIPLLTGERTTTPWVARLGKLAEVVR